MKPARFGMTAPMIGLSSRRGHRSLTTMSLLPLDAERWVTTSQSVRERDEMRKGRGRFLAGRREHRGKHSRPGDDEEPDTVCPELFHSELWHIELDYPS